MKKILNVFPPVALLAGLLLIVSCKDDEDPAPPHEVGEWSLSNFAIINLPDGFQSNEGTTFEVGDITFGGFTTTSYTLELNDDGTFERSIGLQGRLPLEASGSWSLEDDELTLEPEDSGDEFFEVQTNSDDELWLSEEATFGLIPDIYFDTVGQAYLDYLQTLTDEQLDSIGNVLVQGVSLDLVYVFDRQE